MIKILGLALYGPLAASTRYRLGQYVDGLSQYGIELHLRFLLGDTYLQQKFSGSRLPWQDMLKSLAQRFQDLGGQGAYDLSLLHCELIPLMPGWIESGLLKKPYIYDFDDAFYLKYRSGRFSFAEIFLKDKFDRIMESATAITAGNVVLSAYALRHNANTHVLPTVVDTDRYVPFTRSVNEIFTIGWIGSPSTAPYLSELVTVLSALGKEGPVRFVVIGGKAPCISGVTTIEIEWQEQTEVELINTFDVGVMPLPDDDWARGKCAFKLIQYMACAVPVIASPVGANLDVVKNDCGLFAATPQEWLDALRVLRDQVSLRKEMGHAGRERVCEQYSLRRNLPILANVIHEAVKKGS